MGPSDMPKEPPKQADVRPAKTSPEVSKFLDQWVKPDPNKTSSIVSIGQVDTLKIPPGWKEGKAAKPAGGASLLREFHPADNQEVKLCFFYRGTRISDTTGKKFHKVIEHPPHILSSSEVESLREILREKANPAVFKAAAAKTEDIDGKRVLIVEGRYSKTDTETRTIFVDSDGSGTAVQEIFYQAPKADYARHLQVASNALKSIRWK